MTVIIGFFEPASARCDSGNVFLIMPVLFPANYLPATMLANLEVRHFKSGI